MQERKRLKKEQYIDSQAEAYYRALKRIEEEKQTSVVEQKASGQKSFSQKIKLFCKIVFCPSKLVSELEGEKFADVFLAVIVSMILEFTGVCLQIAAVVAALAGVWGLCKNHMNLGAWLTAGNLCLTACGFAIFGGLFKIAGNVLPDMEDPNKLYAYSSGIMAVIAVVIAVIGLFT